MLFQGLGKGAGIFAPPAAFCQKKGLGRDRNFQARGLARRPQLEDEIALDAVVDILHPAARYLLLYFSYQGIEKKAVQMHCLVPPLNLV